MKGNINLISYDCYQQATEKQLAGLKWKENRVYYISEIHNEKMQDEIYGYIDDRCRRLSLSTVVNDIYRFDLLKEFLNEKCTSCSSITDKKWEELERSYKAFLYKKGLALYVRRNRPDRRNVEQQSSAQISFLKMYYEYVVKCKTADIPENEKDVWDMRKLDIVPRSNPIRGRYRLDFREIRQKEFKEIIKKILYSHCQTKAMGSIKGELRGFRRFASFMYDRFPEVKHFTEISRDMIEDYLVYIKTDTGLTSVSYTTELSVLDNLLDEIGRELEIGNICNLFLSSDCRAYDNALPEAYSDAEIRRFNCALTKLKPQLGRCLIIHQMLGTRIEDTLTLRRDCLSEKSGHYFITIIQQKTRKYKRPVSNQLAELIRKAIEVSEKEHPDSEYIFLQDNGKLYTDSMLKYHVNIMIYENDIRDDNGNYFEFRTHRFRHTFGVKLTEMKLDDDSIARLLGHEVKRLLEYFKEEESICQVDENQLDDYFRKLEEKDTKDDTFNKRIVHYIKFYQFLNVRGYMKEIPFKPEYYLKKTYPEHHDRTVEEKVYMEILHKLYAFPLVPRLIFLHLWCTGLRISEVCTLKGDAYYWDGEDAWLKVYQIKMKADKMIPIPLVMYRIMRKYIEREHIRPKDYIFKGKDGGAYRGTTFRQEFQQYCDKNGIADGSYIFKTHDYRHTLATQFYDEDVSIQTIRDYLGHFSEEMTKQYVDFMPKRIEKASDTYFKKPENDLASTIKAKKRGERK